MRDGQFSSDEGNYGAAANGPHIEKGNNVSAHNKSSSISNVNGKKGRSRSKIASSKNRDRAGSGSDLSVDDVDKSKPKRGRPRGRPNKRR